jgi:hypothetical protein
VLLKKDNMEHGIRECETDFLRIRLLQSGDPPNVRDDSRRGDVFREGHGVEYTNTTTFFSSDNYNLAGISRPSRCQRTESNPLLDAFNRSQRINAHNAR